MRRKLTQIQMKITSNRMTNPTGDLPLPLLIICLVSINPLPTASGVTGKPPDLSEYDVYEDTVTPSGLVPVSQQSIQRCDYDPCREDQTPCLTLSAGTGCSCPGFTLDSDIPEAPKLKSVSYNGSGVVVRWCAPYSQVTTYVVAVEGREDELVLEETRRSGVVQDMDHGAKVCVFAVNSAGKSDGSCMMYRPVDNWLPLTSGLIGGAVGLLLLLLLVGLLWRRRRQKDMETRNV
uniref:Epidermal growth factor receptor-like transmembrane-juxtamembrane segment domain-containing protein n=1 Tax=Nothobranchius korthausae TaxID=1143690 RepID=A0A1A8G1C2_9TELE